MIRFRQASLRMLAFLLPVTALAWIATGDGPGRANDPPAAVGVEPDAPIEVAAASFNLRCENSSDTGQRAWRQRLVPVVQMVRNMDPDVMGVQEGFHGQMADLRASLPDYAFTGAGRDDGVHGGEYTGIFHRRGRFTASASDQGCFWLSPTPEIPGSIGWGNTLPRMVAWVHLNDATTGRGFYVFNTHWDHRNQDSRERAALLLAERIDRRQRPGDPVILLGDFNAIETNPALAYLRGQAAMLAGASHRWQPGLTDSWLALHPDAANRRTLHLWSGRREGALKIDHILASRGVAVLAAEIHRGGNPLPSDHFPVSATLRFPPPAAD